jgi:ABC-type glycerol-3-phosphate transport system substrate-binding protein
MKLFKSLVLVFSVVILAGFFVGSVGAQTKLTLWYPAGEVTAGAAHFGDKTLFTEFEAKNNCKVEMVAGEYDTLIQKIITAMVGGDVPDILFIDRSWVPGFLKEEVLDPVPAAEAKAWLSQVTPEIVELSDYGQGKMYGYPQYGIDVYGITWNKDQFREAGLDPEKAPRTWAELREYCKKLVKTDASGNITRVGLAIRHVGQPHGVVHKFLWAIWAGGGDLVSDPKALRGGQAKFNTPGVKEALQLVYDMIYVDKSTSLNFPDPRDAFLKGVASMQISETISIHARAPKEAPNLKWGVALPPVRNAGDRPVSNLNSWFYSVPTKSKNKELAWKAIQYINSADKDYELCKKFNSTPRYKASWAKEPFKSDPYCQSLIQMLPYGRAYPNNLGLNGIMEALGAAIQKVWHNEAKVDAALAEAEALANKAIKEAEK